MHQGSIYYGDSEPQNVDCFSRLCSQVKGKDGLKKPSGATSFEVESISIVKARDYGVGNPTIPQIWLKAGSQNTDILQELWDGITPSKKETLKRLFSSLEGSITEFLTQNSPDGESDSFFRSECSDMLALSLICHMIKC